MKNATSERATRRMWADQEELAERIARATPHEGTVEVQPGLHFRRCSRPTERLYSFTKPSFCVIAQGSKELVVGGDHFRYDPAHYMISTVELPMIGQVVEASPERPYLGLWLALDPSVVTSVMVESAVAQRGDGSGVKSLDVSALDANLLDATLRLVRLVEVPLEYRVLAPLAIREIVFRLLTGAQAGRLRRLMLSEDLDAAEAGYRVGYDDASHFNREYKRHFGEPPMRDVGRLRELATA